MEWIFLIFFFNILSTIYTYKMKQDIVPRPQNVVKWKGIEKSEDAINYQKICIFLCELETFVKYLTYLNMSFYR